MGHAHTARKTTIHRDHAARGVRLSAFEVGALLAIAVGLLIAAAGTFQPSAAVSVAPVKVESGETLWQIARAHPVDGLSTAQTVEFIAEKNRLRGGTILAGETLLVPSALGGEPSLAMR